MPNARNIERKRTTLRSHVEGSIATAAHPAMTRSTKPIERLITSAMIMCLDHRE